MKQLNMDNNIQYNFKDFTHKHYDELVKLARETSSFVTYTDNLPERTDNFVLWRHDIDFSVHEALNLARIEHSNNVKSTYFILFSSEFYNVFEKRILDLLFEIKELGHEFGLHFDPLLYQISNEGQLIERLNYEKYILENLLDVKISAFSFHNPTPEILVYNKWKYDGLINTYASFFQNQCQYCSDSNGYWRHTRLYDFLIENAEKPKQVLTHPAWWTEREMSPKERIWRCLDQRAQKTKEYYIKSLKEYGRQHIDN